MQYNKDIPVDIQSVQSFYWIWHIEFIASYGFMIIKHKKLTLND